MSSSSNPYFLYFDSIITSITKHWYFSWEGGAGKGGWGVQVGQRGFGGQFSKDVSVFRMTKTLIVKLSKFT